MVRIALPLVLVLTLSACAGGGRPDFVRAGTGGEMAYARAANALENGDTATALAAYRCAAAYGPGYEVAWHNLGVTALNAAAAPGVSAEAAEAYRTEGYAALETAANAGWAASQAELATRHLAAGHSAEAARWSAIYRTNNRDQALGLTRLPEATANAIAANASDAERAAAIEAAADFFPRALQRSEPGEGCDALTGAMRREREVNWQDVIQPSVGTSRPTGQ
ncbi:MAG: hypothetical protein CMF74_17325 [Maricaulis sp.]|jgi:hypothetical protein|nr:hypothetical protein [Maricaulis sp.]HAQ34902.1 hypothetical protein [Alphaproteobacteria bacterium]